MSLRLELGLGALAAWLSLSRRTATGRVTEEQGLPAPVPLAVKWLSDSALSLVPASALYPTGTQAAGCR